MSSFPAAIDVDDAQEFHALHDAIETAVTAARERCLDAEDACARGDVSCCDECSADALQAEDEYRRAEDALRALLILWRRVESVDVDEQVAA